MRKRTWPALLMTLLGCALATSVMFVYFKIVTGFFMPPVLPEIQTDALYYLVQVKEVLDGYPLLGNPYIIEHANARFPGLILPIWLTAIPGFLGLGINAVYAANALLYSMLLGALLFMICNKINKNKIWISAGIAVLGVASLHNLMIRPVIMQTVYPAFALFAFALIGLLEAPHERRRFVYLGAATALSFYLYPYLWMITFTTVGLLGILSLWKRDRVMFTYLIVMCAGVAVVCLPQILLTATLFTDEMARELHGRIGLVNTHLLNPYGMLFAKYTLLIAASLLLLRFRRGFSNPETALFLLACALLIATVSNGITGKEMHFDTHFWRIGMFVTIVAIAVMLGALRRGAAQRLIALVCLAGLLLTTVNRVAIRAGGYAYLRQPEITRQRHRDIQEYAEVFAFFEDTENKVIMTTARLSSYIPLYTKNYIFFFGPARSHTISNAELIERFLVQYIDYIDEQYLIDNMVSYAGWRPERESVIRNFYGESLEPVDILGGRRFLSDMIEKSREIDKEYGEILRSYQVNYIVLDTLAEDNPRLPSGATPVHQTDRFTIYSLP